jgi:hypothetical protein
MYILPIILSEGKLYIAPAHWGIGFLPPSRESIESEMQFNAEGQVFLCTEFYIDGCGYVKNPFEIVCEEEADRPKVE